MKLSLTIFAASAVCVSSFTMMPSQKQSSQLFVATKGKVAPFRKALSSLTKDNFSNTLSEVESFLTDEAGSTLYVKSMRRIAVKAKALGVAVPENYAKEAKTTTKKRAKQDAYCSAKTEAAAAAVAEAKAAEEAAIEEAKAAAEAAIEEAKVAAEAAASVVEEPMAEVADEEAVVA
jgi:uncharacterized membrane protein YqiK